MFNNLTIKEMKTPEFMESMYSRIAQKHVDMIQEIRDLNYSHLSRKERQADIQSIRNSSTDPKIMRNEPCPCGSGRKYKNCCLK